jgi:hypothetical protein
MKYLAILFLLFPLVVRADFKDDAPCPKGQIWSKSYQKCIAPDAQGFFYSPDCGKGEMWDIASQKCVRHMPKVPQRYSGKHPFPGTLDDYARSGEQDYKELKFPEDARLLACSLPKDLSKNKAQRVIIYPHQTSNLYCSIGEGAAFITTPQKIYDSGFKLIQVLEGDRFIVMYFDKR